MDDRGPYITKQRVADRFDNSTRAVDRWRADPDLGFPQPIVINGALRFSLPEIIAWEARRASESAAKYDKGIIKTRRGASVAEQAVEGKPSNTQAAPYTVIVPATPLKVEGETIFQLFHRGLNDARS
jgi:hypothetical protein